MILMRRMVMFIFLKILRPGFSFLKFLNLDIVPMTYFLTLVITGYLAGFIVPYDVSALPTWLGIVIILPLLIGSILLRKLFSNHQTFFKEINHKGERPMIFLEEKAG
jgi:hypothetical protein